MSGDDSFASLLAAAEIGNVTVDFRNQMAAFPLELFVVFSLTIALIKRDVDVVKDFKVDPLAIRQKCMFSLYCHRP